jgi:hypothetical protein
VSANGAVRCTMKFTMQGWSAFYKTAKSAGAQVMTKGQVSLALSGTGRGVDLGVVLGAMTISR